MINHPNRSKTALKRLMPVSSPRGTRRDFPAMDPDYYWYRDADGWHGPFLTESEMEARISGEISGKSPADVLRDLGATPEEIEPAYRLWLDGEGMSSLADVLATLRRL